MRRWLCALFLASACGVSPDDVAPTLVDLPIPQPGETAREHPSDAPRSAAATGSCVAPAQTSSPQGEIYSALDLYFEVFVRGSQLVPWRFSTIGPYSTDGMPARLGVILSGDVTADEIEIRPKRGLEGLRFELTKSNTPCAGDRLILGLDPPVRGSTLLMIASDLRALTARLRAP